MLSVTVIYVDGNFCHLVLLHAYIFVFCLASRIPSISTLSTSKTVMTIIHWLQVAKYAKHAKMSEQPKKLIAKQKKKTTTIVQVVYVEWNGITIT